MKELFQHIKPVIKKNQFPSVLNIPTNNKKKTTELSSKMEKKLHFMREELNLISAYPC